jgi:hypothetical protein
MGLEHCPDELVLTRFARGLASEAELESVASHLDTCPSCRHAVAEASSDEPLAPSQTGEPPETIGRWQIEGVLGRGAMGLVLLARDPKLDRRVALKLLLQPTHDVALEARLEREARAMAQLNHPNVVTLYELGEWAGRRYLVMEHVQGVTLDRWLAQAKRAPAEVVRAVVQAGRGLAAAHSTGLVHRDVKPSNLLVGADGRVRVTDFGLARVEPGRGPASVGAGLEVTQHGTIVGTPAWMAPEQLDGAVADAASDQFAVCVVLVEALGGQRPWTADTSDALRAAMRRPPFLERVPRKLRAVLRRGLSESPSARFPSMSALLDALEGAPARERRVRMLLVGAVALVALAVAGRAWLVGEDTLSLAVGAMTTVQVDCLQRVAIGDPNVADVKPLESGNLLLVLGRAPGETTLITFDCFQQRHTWLVRVTGAAPLEAQPGTPATDLFPPGPFELEDEDDGGGGGGG